MILFVITLLLAYLYLGLRLSSSGFDWVMIGTLFLAILSFPYRKVFRFQIHLSYLAMGILTYLIVFTLLRDLIWILTTYLAPIKVVIALTFFCNLFGFVNAIRGPKMRKINLPVEDLPGGLHGLKVVQISDLHIGATIRKRYVENVVDKINKENPDIIVMTGDIGDGKVGQYREDVLPLSRLRSRYGTFFTPGNHEYYWNVNEWLTVMNNMGIINIVNRGKILEHNSYRILVAGVPDPVSRISADLTGILEAAGSEPLYFKILLSHRPGIAAKAASAGFDLQLSGHTHGGQFFPWTLVVKMVHKISKGLHKVGTMWIYVNPGTGQWGPLLRLGTDSEITFFTLTQTKRGIYNNKRLT